jgi:hypothetical protein
MWAAFPLDLNNIVVATSSPGGKQLHRRHYHNCNQQQQQCIEVVQVMMRNLVTRGCPLYSLEAYPDLSCQKARLVLLLLSNAITFSLRCHICVSCWLQVPVSRMAACQRERPR